MSSRDDDELTTEKERIARLPIQERNKAIDQYLKQLFARSVLSYPNEFIFLNLSASAVFLRFQIETQKSIIEHLRENQQELLKELGSDPIELKIKDNFQDNQSLNEILEDIKSKRDKIFSTDPNLKIQDNIQELNFLEQVDSICRKLLESNSAITLINNKIIDIFLDAENHQNLTQLLERLSLSYSHDSEQSELKIKMNILKYIQFLIEQELLPSQDKFGTEDRASRPEVFVLKRLKDEVKKDLLAFVSENMISVLLDQIPTPRNPKALEKIATDNRASFKDGFEETFAEFFENENGSLPIFNENDFDFCYTSAIKNTADIITCMNVLDKINETDFTNPFSINALDNYLISEIGSLAVTNQRSAENLIQKIAYSLSFYPVNLYSPNARDQIYEKIKTRALEIEKNKRIGTIIDNLHADLKIKMENAPQDSSRQILRNNAGLLDEIDQALLHLNKILQKRNDHELENAISNLIGTNIGTLEERLISLKNEIQKRATTVGGISDDLRHEMSDILANLKTWKENFYQEEMRLESVRHSIEMDRLEFDRNINEKLVNLREREAQVLQKEQELLEASRRLPKANLSDEPVLDEKLIREQIDREKRSLNQEKVALQAKFDSLMLKVEQTALELQKKEDSSNELAKQLAKERAFLDKVFERLAKGSIRPFDWKKEENWAELELITDNLPLKKEIERLKDLIEEASKRENGLQEQLNNTAALKSALDDALNKNQQQEQELKRQLAEITKLNDANEELRQSAKRIYDDFESLQKQNKLLALELAKEKEEHDKDRNALAQEKEEHGKTRNALAQEKEEHGKTRNALAMKDQELQSLRQQLESITKISENEINDLKRRLESEISARKAIEQKAQQLQADLDKSRQIGAENHRLTEELKLQLSELEKQLAFSKETIAKLNEKINSLENDLLSQAKARPIDVNATVNKSTKKGVRIKSLLPDIPKHKTEIPSHSSEIQGDKHLKKEALLFGKKAPKLSVGSDDWIRLFKGRVAKKIADPNVNVKCVATSNREITSKQFSQICHSIQQEISTIQKEIQTEQNETRPEMLEVSAEDNSFAGLKMEVLGPDNARMVRERTSSVGKPQKEDLFHLYHVEKKIEVVSSDPIPEDDAMFVMVLTIKKTLESMGRKNFTIANCEENPMTALKLFLIGKSLGLNSVFKDSPDKKGETERNLRGAFGDLTIKVHTIHETQEKSEEKTIREIFDEVKKMSFKDQDTTSINLIKNYIAELKILEEQTAEFHPTIKR